MGRVAVTGSSGKLGRAVVERPARERLGRRQPRPRRIAATGLVRRVDFTDFGQTVEALTGIDDRHGRIDAVVHLAAMPAPGLPPNAATFANNMTSTYNVFQAATGPACERSSGRRARPCSACRSTSRRRTCPSTRSTRRGRKHLLARQDLEEEMAAPVLPVGPRAEDDRAAVLERDVRRRTTRHSRFDADPRLRKWNLWGYIDARDGAQAVRLALEATSPARTCSSSRTPTRSCRGRRVAGGRGVPGVEVRKALGEHETLLSIDKARRVLGYEPEHS